MSAQTDAFPQSPPAPLSEDSDRGPDADRPRIVPVRRTGQWAAAVAVLALLAYDRTHQVVPLLLVATVWYAAVTSPLSIGQHCIERHYARGSAGSR